MVDKLKFIWMDGKLVDWDQAKIHVLTHTFHYGLGAFEGIRAYKGGGRTTGNLPPQGARPPPVRFDPDHGI